MTPNLRTQTRPAERSSGDLPPSLTTVEGLLAAVTRLRDTIANDAKPAIERWTTWNDQPDFLACAINFAHYLALREHDLRDLQRELAARGLSSLGRSEGRVMPTLDAVIGALSAMAGNPSALAGHDGNFFADEARIAKRAEALFGTRSEHGPVNLMVTLPGEAADDSDFFLRLAAVGVEAVRINCAHDDEGVWRRMIEQVEHAGRQTGRRMRIMMDLAGPKIRTGEVRRDGDRARRVLRGDPLAITLPGHLASVAGHTPALECTLSAALEAARVGDRVLLDDGKLETRVEACEHWGILVRVLAGPDEKGYKLKAEKGINFPDTEFSVPALTEADLDALEFVARHADAVEFSFVQDEPDVRALQQALARIRPDDWQAIGLILKIETARALRNLPDMVMRAAACQPTGIMIARGDLAVEIGFARLAEMQEEILWLAEAAQVPVIWATQVLESYMKKGVPSRGEMTDAAMAVRAECVMLNKGPYLFEAITALDGLLGRMGEHVHKKAARLRPLRTWQGAGVHRPEPTLRSE